jgi:DNA-binding winged helix-turn-helix (wHTH) protein/Tfp pilus assembly protein PilF
VLSGDILFGPFVLRIPQQELWHAGTPVALKPKEADLLALLAASRPRTISKDEIIERLWRGTAASDAALTQTVYRLRQTLAHYARGREFIRTIPGIGLQFTGGSPIETKNHHPDFQRTTFPLLQQAVAKFRHRTEGAILQSIGLLENICRRDPGYLAARTLLAKAYTTAGIRMFYDPREAYWRAKRELAAVIEDAPDSADAFAVLATLAIFFGADRETTRSAVEHALILGPHLPAAHNAAVWERLARRDFAAALTQADLAVAARPDSAHSSSQVGIALYLAGRFEEARTQFANALALHAQLTPVLFYDSCACFMLGDYQTALQRLNLMTGTDMAPRVTALRGSLAAKQGDSDGARAALAALSASPFPVDISICGVHLAMGDAQASAAALERALPTREPALFLAAIDPIYAPLCETHPHVVRAAERGRAPRCDRCAVLLRPSEVQEFFRCSLCARCRALHFALPGTSHDSKAIS